jgi:hypothetical protein
VEAGVLPSAQLGVAPVWCFRPHDPAKEAKALRISLDKNAATLTFVSSGDAKADLQMIDLLLEEASR